MQWGSTAAQAPRALAGVTCTLGADSPTHMPCCTPACRPPAKKGPAAGLATSRVPIQKRQPAKPAKPAKRAQDVRSLAAPSQRAGSQAAAAAEPPEQGLPVFAVQQRLRGEELLEDDDEELVRQVGTPTSVWTVPLNLQQRAWPSA